MYFDARLWRLTRGLRAGMAGGILLGLLALAAGGVCSIAVAVGVLSLLHADAALVRAMFAKSVTAPIAMGIAERIGA